MFMPVPGSTDAKGVIKGLLLDHSQFLTLKCNTQTHTHVCLHKQTITHTHAPTHTNTYSLIHTQTYTHIHTNPHKSTLAYTQIHTHTHTHIC